MCMRKSNHPQLLRAAVSAQLNHLHVLTARTTTTITQTTTTTTRSEIIIKKTQPACVKGFGCPRFLPTSVSQERMGSKRTVARLCLESEGRGGGDGWDRIHPFLQSKER